MGQNRGMVVAVILAGALFLEMITLAVGQENSGGMVPKGYGESCSCHADCDFSKWLTCQEGNCRCLSSSFMYEYANERCSVRLGHKCFDIGKDYKEYADLPPSLRCVTGSFCSISAGGLCSCNVYGFYRSGDYCEPRRELMASCSSNSQCLERFECNLSRGRCDCRKGETFSEERDRCVAPLGAYCKYDLDCPELAECDVSSRCKCIPGFQAVAGGSTTSGCAKALKYGDSCGPSESCHNYQLSCFSGKCLCRYPDHQVFDNGTGACLSLVGSASCQEDGDCIENAECSNGKDSSDGSGSGYECNCKSGFLEMADGTCSSFSPFGATCLDDSVCDPIPPLLCKDSVCQCKDSLMNYDQGSRLCRGLVGFRNCLSKGVDLCVQGAECVQYNPQLGSKCKCRINYIPTNNRTCALQA